MKEDIISQKIRRELDNLPIDTEPRVMYLLVEIRKVLEHDGITNTNLGFYGNWVVHTKLDRAFAARIFNEINNDDSEVGYKIKTFNLLKDELREFLQEHCLPTDLTDKHWIIFREKLTDILIDTPIIDETGTKSFGFYKKDGLGGVQYYLKEGQDCKTLGRVWI